jgi:hypothetical protein
MSHVDDSSAEGNGQPEPCWVGKDCQLAQDQRAGNEILHEMLRELRDMNDNLVAPATNANRVPLNLFILTLVLFTLLILTDRATRSGYELMASPNSLSVTRPDSVPQKKTE